MEISKVAFIGNYVPRQCGIATFTSDLCRSVSSRFPEMLFYVLPMNDVAEGYDYPEEVRFEIQEDDLKSYLRAADYLNINNIDIINIQHEFGIFGGPSGSHIVPFLKNLNMPVVTTFHTVLQDYNEDQRKVMKEIMQWSTRVVVMTRKGFDLLNMGFPGYKDKIDIIPHGIPDLPFVDSSFYKDEFDVNGKNVILTFGLLSENKGVENVIKALPKIVSVFPDTVYIILGATHPKVFREKGDAYRLGLERLAVKRGVEKNIVFCNRFVEQKELMQFICACDVYITPYLNENQVVSGTLSYAFGAGKAVVSTPYWHAVELLADNKGLLTPFGDSERLADAAISLFADPVKTNAMRKNAYLMSRDFVWDNVSGKYMNTFQKARSEFRTHKTKRRKIKTLDMSGKELPLLNLNHVNRLTDSTGIIQHAVFSVPDLSEGYCTDDNARALVLNILLDEADYNISEITQRNTIVYASYLQHAFDKETGRFRNFMSYDRKWRKETNIEDANGRAIWALGTCIGRTRNPEIKNFATKLFHEAINATSSFNSPRAWAFSMLGIHEYLKTFNGDRAIVLIRENLASKLMDMFEKNASDDWKWPEDILTYDNAKLPHALFISGKDSGNQKMLNVGLDSLEWLYNLQIASAGFFRPVSTSGIRRGEKQKTLFDQQPLEAHSNLSACLAVFKETSDQNWFRRAANIFEWYMGNNDLGLEVYDSSTGGCRDGMHIDRLNFNQGAESTLSFLLSLVEMQAAQYEVKLFNV